MAQMVTSVFGGHCINAVSSRVNERQFNQLLLPVNVTAPQRRADAIICHAGLFKVG
jgi:hypothetical protein